MYEDALMTLVTAIKNTRATTMIIITKTTTARITAAAALPVDISWSSWIPRISRMRVHNAPIIPMIGIQLIRSPGVDPYMMAFNVFS